MPTCKWAPWVWEVESVHHGLMHFHLTQLGSTQSEQTVLFLQTHVLSVGWADLSWLPISLLHFVIKTLSKRKTGRFFKDTGLNKNNSEQGWQMQNYMRQVRGKNLSDTRELFCCTKLHWEESKNEFMIMRKSNKPQLEINKMRTYGRDFSVSAESKGKLVYKSFASRVSPFGGL